MSSVSPVDPYQSYIEKMTALGWTMQNPVSNDTISSSPATWTSGIEDLVGERYYILRENHLDECTDGTPLAGVGGEPIITPRDPSINDGEPTFVQGDPWGYPPTSNRYDYSNVVQTPQPLNMVDNTSSQTEVALNISAAMQNASVTDLEDFIRSLRAGMLGGYTDASGVKHIGLIDKTLPEGEYGGGSWDNDQDQNYLPRWEDATLSKYDAGGDYETPAVWLNSPPNSGYVSPQGVSIPWFFDVSQQYSETVGVNTLTASSQPDYRAGLSLSWMWGVFEWEQWYREMGYHSTPIIYNTADPSTIGGPYAGFLNDYMASMGMSAHAVTDGSGFAAGTPWSLLADKLYSALGIPSNAIFPNNDAAVMGALMEAAFKTFLNKNRSSYLADSSNFSDPNALLGLWGDFLSPITTVVDNAQLANPDSYLIGVSPNDPTRPLYNAQPSVVNNLDSYERMYFAFHPQATQDQYYTELANFIAQDLIPKDGYFLPSKQVTEWFDKLQRDYTASLVSGGIEILNDRRYQQAIIMNEVFDILVSMISTIQQAAVAQGARLKILAAWEQQYTKVMGQTHIFNTADDSEISVNDPGGNDEATNFSIANTAQQTARENMRAFRDIISDDVRELQTSVSQTSDSASQQASIATALLQSLEGIVTLIFR